ncbi:serine hydrolase domain-containing protein [Solimonas marina]|uniref:Beta-lactamase family protein n=1 Tax=Solimonas marina TaxID=2714601 RepID=A0A970B9P9_9GAMM|nr:serine hydrolase domain-containing protein [Solimonas marina]NKF23574.1 beta-lactamase family protein [Solimonas marina]
MRHALNVAALLLAMGAGPLAAQPTPTPTPTPAQVQAWHALREASPYLPFSGAASEDAEEFRYESLHSGEFLTSARIARGGPVAALPYALRPEIGAARVQTRLGAMTVDQFVERFPMDGVLILHHGRIVYERYPKMRADDAHLTYSVSKVIPALLVAELVDLGRVDPRLGIEHYIPRLAHSQWAGVTVQNILDMASGMQKTGLEDDAWEDEFWASMMGRLPGSTYDYVAAMQRNPEIPQGTDFEYGTQNSFVLAWLVETMWKRPFADVVSDRLWTRIGAEHDALVGVSPDGAPHPRIAMTLRDLGRVGLLYTPSWRMVSRTRLVSKAALHRTQFEGRPALLKGIEVDLNERSFPGSRIDHNGWQWDAVFGDGTMWKSGFGGQGLMVSPQHDLVVAFFGSWPATGRPDYNRFQWLARQLVERGYFDR